VVKKRKKKKEDDLVISTVNIPTSIFRDRSLSVLEAVVEYLKEHHNLNYHQIARLLNRDERTVWTVYSRAKKKRK
jgi:transcriptional regulatory protein LevR